jgi:AraC family transcriptional regulator of adaptative response / DNA-3-methyladenine glycosylase II
LEAVDESGVRRSVRLGGRVGVLDVRPHATRPELVVSVAPALSRDLLVVRRRVARMFDLSGSPDVVMGRLREDPVLSAALAGRTDLRVAGRWDPFEATVRAVLGQGVSVAAAGTLAARLVARTGEALPGPSLGVTRLFPTPERLAVADLDGLGVPAARSGAVRALAAAVARGELRFDAFAGLDDAVERLCGVPGIGPWTAHYVALRALGEPDAFPAGDLVLRRVASRLAGRELSRAELAARAERWRPWRAYAATALWDHARAHARARAAA